MLTSLRRFTSILVWVSANVVSIAAASDSLIEEVVVTAAKRQQTLQEIPVAVTVTSAEVINQAQIQSISDLQSVVPSLRVSQLQSSINTNFVIRGFGNGANNPGIEPSVGVFIDGVYRSRSAAAISDLPRLERVEVLRGPQSTLFGKNASAGVINVVTAKPSGQRASDVSATVGNFGQIAAKLYYEDAITSNASFSLALSHNARDGYNTNLVTDNQINNLDRQALRGQLLLNASERTEIRVIADFDTFDEECCSALNVVSGPVTAAIEFAGGQLVANDSESFTSFSNIDPINLQDNAGISAQVTHDFENVTLTSISSVRALDSLYNIDVDFTSAALLTNEIDTQIDTFTQELRLTSTSGGKIDWVLGGFYVDESIDFSNDLPFGAGFRPFLNALTAPGVPPQLISQLNGVSALEAALGLPVGTTFSQAGEGVTEVSTLENDAFSLFGQFDFHLNESLSVTLGLNYTNDKKDATTEQIRTDAFSSLDLEQIGTAGAFSAITGLSPTAANFAAVPAAAQAATQVGATPCSPQTEPNCNALLALQPAQFLPPFLAFPNAVEDGQSDDDELTYTVRLSYDVNDSTNIYGGVSTGFKATSWNLSRDSRPFETDLAAVEAAGLTTPNLISGSRFAGPEEATVYEIGLKARFERGSLNLAVFDQSIKGFQSNIFIGTGFDLTNAGEQSTRGVEFDAVYYPVEGLRLSVAGTFLDPIFDSFDTAGRDPQTGAVFDLSGQTPGGINEASLSVSAVYNFELANNEAFVRADYFYEDTVPIGDLEIAQFERDTQNLNVAAGITNNNGLSVSVWGRNVTNHVSLISAFRSVLQTGSFSGYRTAPRTYGVTISKSF